MTRTLDFLCVGCFRVVKLNLGIHPPIPLFGNLTLDLLHLSKWSVYIHEILPHAPNLHIFLAHPGDSTGQCPYQNNPMAFALGHLDAFVLSSVDFILDAGYLAL
jgi:hypothetical protein